MVNIVNGSIIPGVWMGVLNDGVVEKVYLPTVLGLGRSILVGVPGAFTPVCSQEHVPDFVANADRLRANGFEHIVCVVANDPFVMAAWAAQVDPKGKITFLSDGNLDLANKLGVKIREPDLFLGQRAQRYLLTARGGVIERLTVENSILAITCTRARDGYVAL